MTITIVYRRTTVNSYLAFTQKILVEMANREGLRAIPHLELKILNIVSGFAIITVLAMFLNHEGMALALLNLSLFFLVAGFFREYFRITRTDYQTSTLRDEEYNIYRIGHLVVFFLNVVVLLIYWFPLPFPGPDAEFGEAFTTLLLYGGFPMIVLYYDFEKLGKALAQAKCTNSVPG